MASMTKVNMIDIESDELYFYQINMIKSKS